MSIEVLSWHNSTTIIIESNGRIHTSGEYEQHTAHVMGMLALAGLPNVIIDNRNLIIPKLPSTNSDLALFIKSNANSKSAVQRIIIIVPKDQVRITEFTAHYLREYGIHVEVYTSLVLAMNELLK